jgi:hypothetical protein
MPKFQITVTREAYTSYEITTDIDDPESAQKLEQEKLESDDYETSLKLEWSFFRHPPEIVEFDEA